MAARVVGCWKNGSSNAAVPRAAAARFRTAPHAWCTAGATKRRQAADSRAQKFDPPEPGEETVVVPESSMGFTIKRPGLSPCPAILKSGQYLLYSRKAEKHERCSTSNGVPDSPLDLCR